MEKNFVKMNIMDLFPEEIEKQLLELGEKPFRAEQIFAWIFKGITNFSQMTNLSMELREKLDRNFALKCVKTRERLISKIDKTRKYIFTLNDGNIIESVLMFYKHGVSACLSTQVGCKMGCTFCASTGVGFIRNLTPGEILDQIVVMQQDAGERISNVVLMGIGEPLDNFANVEKFLRLVNHKDGLNIGTRHISISTCGLVPEIKMLMETKLQVTLSVSLHAAVDEVRTKMMPINNRYSIDKILTACKIYTRQTGRRITFEYAMIKGINDGLGDAVLLAQRLKGILCHVNLIPVNEVLGTKNTKSDKESIQIFKDLLVKNGINTTVRRELGTDIDAACGQLRRSIIEKQNVSLGVAQSNIENQNICLEFEPRILENQNVCLGVEHLKIGALTNTGLVREKNEDYFNIIESPHKILAAVIADGMGGHNAGEVASKTATLAFSDFFKENMTFNIIAVEELDVFIKEAIRTTNSKVNQVASRNPTNVGMGTTLTAAIIFEKHLCVGHVGDSRLYIFRDGQLERITTDHSYIEELIKSGTITREEARLHPQKNVITKALGCDAEVFPDIYNEILQRNDILLMCTDGLTNMVLDSEIINILSEEIEPTQMCSELINLANQNGGDDNVTVIIIKIGDI